jgi:PBP1b-binding outer membrane lipoprotein LpoB
MRAAQTLLMDAADNGSGQLSIAEMKQAVQTLGLIIDGTMKAALLAMFDHRKVGKVQTHVSRAR